MWLVNSLRATKQLNQKKGTAKMINWVVKWGVKKWLVGVVNTALVDFKDKVGIARACLHAAITKVEAVTAFLKSIDGKLADNQVTEEEADAAIEEATALAARLVG